MLPSSAGATSIMLDESFGFKAAPSLQQRSSDLTYKFIDSESYFLEGDVTVLVRSLQPNPEADRIAFFNEARRCRRRCRARACAAGLPVICMRVLSPGRACLRSQPRADAQPHGTDPAGALVPCGSTASQRGDKRAGLRATP